VVRQLAIIIADMSTWLITFVSQFTRSVCRFLTHSPRWSTSRTTRYRLIRKRKLAEAETEERILDSGSANRSSANELWMSASGDAGVGTEVDDGISDDDVAFQSVPTL